MWYTDIPDIAFDRAHRIGKYDPSGKNVRPVRQCQIDFLFSVTGKKIQCAMRENHSVFIKKSWCESS